MNPVSSTLSPEAQLLEARHPHGILFRQLHAVRQRKKMVSTSTPDVMRKIQANENTDGISNSEHVRAFAAILMLETWEMIKAWINQNPMVLGLTRLSTRNPQAISANEIFEFAKGHPESQRIANYIMELTLETTYTQHKTWAESRRIKAYNNSSDKPEDLLYAKYRAKVDAIRAAASGMYHPIDAGFSTGVKFFMLTLGVIPECFEQKFGRPPAKAELSQLILSTASLAKIVSSTNINTFLNLISCLELPDPSSRDYQAYDSNAFMLVASKRGHEITIRPEIIERASAKTYIGEKSLITRCPANFNGVMTEFLQWMIKIGNEFYIPALAKTGQLRIQEE
ncbi:MAG: hypothetical protein R3A13_02390 [Bdellovibrionota bacterium]